MTAPRKPAADHGRTPENTPIPGGGSWTWDAAAGAWVDVLATKPADAGTKEK